MDSRHVKTINTDSRSKKRIRFASSKERSKKASADVYRSYKNRIGAGVTSAATRESFVHNPRDQVRAKKRHKLNQSKPTTGGKRDHQEAFVKISEEPVKESTVDLDLTDDENVLEASTSFSSEIDVAIDRNASEIFSKFHREIWMLVRSLPEILHNLDKIIDLLMSYMLSPASMRETATPLHTSDNNVRKEYVINHATTDILHLLAVLARDLRHEIHPYLHSKILPRVLQDLLNPPPPPPESMKQPIPLDVTIVEAAFRTLSYIFRYDSKIINDMESMRKYYGMTLGHRRELVRRLSAETFAPQIRKVKSYSARERHIRRILRALASTASQPSSRILQRTQMDATDGISNLLFQLIKGVPGKLHSQGGRILKFTLEYSCRENIPKEGDNPDGKSNGDLVYGVASELLKKLCYYLKESGRSTVCSELFSLLFASVQKYTEVSEEKAGKSDESVQPIIRNLKMVVQIASVQSGNLLQTRPESDLNELCSSISNLCSGRFLESLPLNDRCTVISLLSQIWLPLQYKEFVNIEENVQKALESQYKNMESTHSLSLIFAKHLLPRLDDLSKRNAMVATLITASAKIAKSNPIASIEVVFIVASSNNAVSSDTTLSDKHTRKKCFELFDMVTGRDLSVSLEDQKCLLDACLDKLENEPDDTLCAHISMNMRCAPFLATLSGDIQTQTYKKVTGWLIESFNTSPSTGTSVTNVVKGLAIEAFSFLTLKASESSIEPSVLKKSTTTFQKAAEELLTECNESLWAIRGAASLIPVLEKFNLGPLIADADDAFDYMMPNLRSANHFLRLHTLQILSSYPEKMFVVDHADLDLTDDLDEDEGYHPAGEEKKSKDGPVGPCDLVKVLLKLESLPVRLEDERHIGSLIGKVEVLARTRRLPAVYAEVAANHMLGIFNVKFAPMWQSAEKALLSLTLAHEEIVWPSFETKLVDVIENNTQVTGSASVTGQTKNPESKEKHFDACRRWEDSDGKDVSLFETSLLLVENEGEVSCYHTTDSETVMESVWKVAELSHRIVAKHSRGIVPLFLRFLNEQYFAFHSNDQDARELHLTSFVERET